MDKSVNSRTVQQLGQYRLVLARISPCTLHRHAPYYDRCIEDERTLEMGHTTDEGIPTVNGLDSRVKELC